PLVILTGATSGTLAPGASVNLASAFSCEGFTVGNNAAGAAVEGEDVPTSTSVGSVAVSWDVEVLAPVPEPGEFAFSPAGRPNLQKTPIGGGSPCPDPFPAFAITKVGASPIEFMVTAAPPFLNTPTPTSGTLAPGEVRSINTAFRCDGFNMGLNTGQLVIEREDPDSSASTGGGQVNDQHTARTRQETAAPR